MSADPDTGTDVEADADADSDIDSDAEADISTANTMRERAGESRLKLWIMLGANRLVVTAMLAVGVFASLLVTGVVLFPSIGSVLASGDTVATIFSTMLGAIITGTTLVVTISQLVISQENGPLGDQHERMSNTMDVREYIGELIDRPMPADPSAFLGIIVGETERRAGELRDAVADHESDELRAEVEEFTDSLSGNAEKVQDQLDGARFGTFDVLFAALNYNYSWKVFQIERLLHEHDEALSDESVAILTDLKSTLALFGPAREHIKTFYFEWALIDLSQLILYVSVPSLVVAGGMLTFVKGATVTGATLGVSNIFLVVVLAFTVTTLPFLLLVAYIARVATVAKRTLAIGPLILRDSQR